MVVENVGWQFRKRVSLVIKVILVGALTLQGNTFEKRDHWERIMITYVYMNTEEEA